ncbi:MAG: flagellar basal body L-ring protein FlgH [Magnetococcales bacterium]|nr:flagellar basal body L-ring protein FlgH [Magnetococcales bacterium]
MNGLAKMILLVPVLPLVIAGCGMTRATERPPAPIAVIQPTPPETLSPKKGSIWQSADRNTLFLDNKARNVGDIVKVGIDEATKANQQAGTKLKRESTLAMPSVAGALTGIGKLGNLANNPLINGTEVKSSSDLNAEAGNNKTERTSAFKATVSCVVTQVLPNGNLRIEGRQDITINHENQIILVSGVIRPEDIDANNFVASTQIADARIELTGDGDIDDQQRPGMLNRFFNTINLM